MKFWKFGQDNDFDNHPNKLRDALFDAVAEGKQAYFVKLCQNNKKLIFDYFPTWQKVPEAIRQNPAQVQWYGQGLITVADYFAQNGEPGLIQRLTGPAETNLIGRWDENFRKAQALLAEKREGEAVQLLENLLSDIQQSQGSAVDKYTPKILGLLGIGYFHQGHYEKAVKATEQAYGVCKKQGDVEGIIAYCGNLAEINRHFGNEVQAEQWRHEKEKFLAQMSTASPKTGQVDETEIIFQDAKGRTLRRGDLKGFTGQVQWGIIGRKNIPHQAEKLHQAGREAGQNSDYTTALQLLSQAAELAPTWPSPVYDAAFTYLLKNDFDKALRYYEKVDELAPRGFFTSKTALHTLRQEKNGQLPQGTYALYMSLEGEVDPARKTQIIEQLLESCPNFAPAWKEKANMIKDSEERLKILAKGLECNPDPETKGILLINKATTLNHQGQKQEAIEILSKLALDPNETLQNEHLAKAVLTNLM